MTSDKEIREYANTIDVDTLPRESEYVVMAARPRSQSEPVTDPISGYYHAIYIRDKIKEKKGYIGVSFHVEEV